jgi:hypothetical protein
MVTLQLNQNQADVLIGLLDIATKSGGLNVAEAAVFFSKAIDQQLKAQQDQSEEQDQEQSEES